jgi:hypothetical protein
MNGRKWGRGLAVAAAVLGCSLYASASVDSNVPYPEHYRNWAFAKAKLIPPTAAGQPGFRHHYANRKAAGSWGTGRFDEGSKIVDERVEAIQNANGIWVEGKVLHVAVMEKDHHYPETGGWAFNVFTGDDRTVGLTPEQGKAACFEACHKSQAARDFVFSDYRR